jgi:hypothetical protein
LIEVRVKLLVPEPLASTVVFVAVTVKSGLAGTPLALEKPVHRIKETPKDKVKARTRMTGSFPQD